MRTTNTDENWELLKKYINSPTEITTDALIGYEAAIRYQNKWTSCPDHVKKDFDRHESFLKGFDAGVCRRRQILTMAFGTKPDGSRWELDRKGQVSVNEILSKAERDGVVGNVDITVFDLATGDKKTKTWGI